MCVDSSERLSSSLRPSFKLKRPLASSSLYCYCFMNKGRLAVGLRGAPLGSMRKSVTSYRWGLWWSQSQQGLEDGPTTQKDPVGLAFQWQTFSWYWVSHQGFTHARRASYPELSLQPPLSFKMKHLTLLGHTHAAHSSVLSGAIRSHPPEFWEAGAVETQFQGQAD